MVEGLLSLAVVSTLVAVGGVAVVAGHACIQGISYLFGKLSNK